MDQKVKILFTDSFTKALAELFDENPRAGFAEVFHLIKVNEQEVSFSQNATQEEPPETV